MKNVRIVEQLVIFIANRPGTLADICDALAEANINIYGQTVILPDLKRQGDKPASAPGKQSRLPIATEQSSRLGTENTSAHPRECVEIF